MIKNKERISGIRGFLGALFFVKPEFSEIDYGAKNT